MKNVFGNIWSPHTSSLFWSESRALRNLPLMESKPTPNNPHDVGMASSGWALWGALGVFVHLWVGLCDQNLFGGFLGVFVHHWVGLCDQNIFGRLLGVFVHPWVGRVIRNLVGIETLVTQLVPSVLPPAIPLEEMQNHRTWQIPWPKNLGNGGKPWESEI